MFRDRPGLGLSLGKAKADEDPYVGRGGNENAIACACEAQLQVSLAFGVLSSSFETGPYTGILGSRRGVMGPMSSRRYRFTHLDSNSILSSHYLRLLSGCSTILDAIHLPSPAVRVSLCQQDPSCHFSSLHLLCMSSTVS